MDEVFLTKDELAKRWKCSKSSIDEYISKGELTPSRRVPGTKFLVTYIEELEKEGVRLESFPPYREKKLIKKCAFLEKELEESDELLVDIYQRSSTRVMRRLNEKSLSYRQA